MGFEIRQNHGRLIYEKLARLEVKKLENHSTMAARLK
jgi:hypothetical protein